MIEPKLQAQLRQKFNPDGSKLREQQMNALSILEAVDHVCRRNNIPYWLASGTLLGAARHGGFIPWDDDVDIEILHSDKARFVAACLKDLPEPLKLQCNATDNLYHFNILKVRDTSTTISESCNIGKQKYPVKYNYNGNFIDVFTVEPSKLFFINIATVLTKALMLMKHIWRFPNWAVNVVYKCFQGLFALFRMIVRCLPKNGCYYHTYGSLFKSMRVETELLPTSEIAFEGKMFSAPRCVDAYLTRLYGDYMTLPPIEDRAPHHNNEL